MRNRSELFLVVATCLLLIALLVMIYVPLSEKVYHDSVNNAPSVIWSQEAELKCVEVRERIGDQILVIYENIDNQRIPILSPDIARCEDDKLYYAGSVGDTVLFVKEVPE